METVQNIFVVTENYVEIKLIKIKFVDKRQSNVRIKYRKIENLGNEV